MGQRKLAETQADDLSKRPNVRRKTGNTVLDSTTARKGEVIRAQRRKSENVNLQASQHVVDIPVNKSIYNGYKGEQFSLSQQKQKSRPDKPSLRVIPIGGVGEMGIGKNMTALEYGDEIIIIDMGFLFPGDDYPGINYITPDITYLEQHKNKIKAAIFTHGHLDHIGAFHHLIPRIPAPVYATKFTIGMLQKNMEEENTDFRPEYHELNPENHDRVQLSEFFSLELVRVNHSIPDSAAVVIRTPVGVVVSSGDWRFENDPVDGKMFDLTRLTEIASKEGVLLFMNESTNCEDPGTVTEFSENDIKVSFDQVMDRYQSSRMIISCFSSQIHRMQNIVDVAAARGRKVAFAGYSMIQNVEIGIKTGQLKIPANTVVKMEDIIKLPDSKVCIVCTGSQGEFNAVLNRMASGSHRFIKIKNSDIIVFSSNPIPGNENHVTYTVDSLMREGSDVLQNRHISHYGFGPLHLSGHGKREDHIKLITALNPKFYLPNHGEFHMLVHNSEIAEFEAGIPRDNIFVCDAGDVVEFYHDGTAKKTGRVQAGGTMYDDAGAIVSEVVLKDRIHMSTEGIFVVVLTVQRGTGHLLSSPDIISRGLIYLRDSEELINSVRQYVKQKAARAYASRRIDMEQFKRDLRDDITQILYDQTKRTPIVIPVVNEIGGSGQNRRSAKIEDGERRDLNFEKQEVQRIRGQSSAHFAPKKSAQQNRPPRRLPNSSDSQAPKTPAEISFKKTPTGPNPMRMWRE